MIMWRPSYARGHADRAEQAIRIAMNTNSDDWVEILPPMPPTDARNAFHQWQASHPLQAPLTDEDVRVDIIHTTSHECLARHRIRRQLLGDQSEEPGPDATVIEDHLHNVPGLDY
jgi:hypothetical protein